MSILGVASTVAHELGHNLGMSHDTAERQCSCQNEPRLGGCIMEPSTGLVPAQLTQQNQHVGPQMCSQEEEVMSASNT